jgi:hypothetical protein
MYYPLEGAFCYLHRIPFRPLELDTGLLFDYDNNVIVGTEMQQSVECLSFIGSYVMGKCNWCGAEMERDKLFAHQWEKHRAEIPDQRRKQGATRVKKAQQTAQQKAQEGATVCATVCAAGRRNKAMSHYAKYSAGVDDGVRCGVYPLLVSPKIRELLPFPMSVGYSWLMPILILYITRFVMLLHLHIAIFLGHIYHCRSSCR